MGVDVIDVLGIEVSTIEGRPHGAKSAVAVVGWRCNVMRIARHAISNQLGINLGAALAGMLQILKHDDA